MKKFSADLSQKEGLPRTKVELMDQSIASAEKIDGPTVCAIIREVFGMDLAKASLLDKDFAKRAAASASAASDLSEAAVDLYIVENGECTSGAEARALLNRIFGTNLEGISELHQQRISLYSKEQWIVQNEKDLFIVYTGKDDVDVKVIPTPYFTGKTGMDRLPENLQQALSKLGFAFDEQVDAYYFANPSGQSVPGLFKRQTMGAIHQTIQDSYSSL